MVALIDTNVLVYRFDARFPEKRGIATDVLRRGIEDDTARLPHQAIIEFVAAVTRVKASDGQPLLAPADARREAEELLSQFTVLYPNEAIVRTALRGAAAPINPRGLMHTFGRMRNTTASVKFSPKTSKLTVSMARSEYATPLPPSEGVLRMLAT